MPFEFVFLRPWWLLLIPVGLLLAYSATRTQRDGWMRVCDRELYAQLQLIGDRVSQRWLWAVLMIGWLLAVIALAGPAWDRDRSTIYQASDPLVVVFDLSRSMNSIDLAPSRLQRARYKALEVVEAQQGKPVGLVAFAGDAFAVTPVSDDVRTVAHLLESLQIRMMPVQGSNASLGLERAYELLSKSGYKRGTVLLVTDGVDEQALAAAEQLRQDNYRLSVIAAGTAAGAPIRLEDGDFLKDAAGNFIVSPVDHALLEQLASIGGGLFTQVTEPFSESFLQSIRFGGDSVELSDEQHSNISWNDRGPWFLLLLLPLVALIFRRGWIVSVLVLLVPFTTEPSHAFEWEDLWLRSDQQAAAAVERSEFENQHISAHSDWHGIALYRQDRFDEAAAQFGQRSDSIANYNQGNAFAKSGELQAAVEHYESALRLDPEFEDAQFNLDLVKQVLQQQQRQQNQNSESRDNQDSNTESESQQQAKPDEEPPTGERAESEDEQNKERPREPAEQLAEAQQAAEQEQEQLMEQWLREIPDDPAGLLRRRFYYEYQNSGQQQRVVNAW